MACKSTSTKSSGAKKKPLKECKGSCGSKKKK